MDEQEIFEDFETVSEMTTDPGGLVPLPPEIVAEVTEGDDDPRFATFVIESGWSKSKRYWGPELFGEVVSEINNAARNEPIVGYMGHIRPDDHGYAFPEIQLQWVGAKLLQGGEKAKMAVKAYVLPGTKGRDYLKRGIVKTVSWRGVMSGSPFQKGERVDKFRIESIDLSRPRAAGMSARLAGALSSEMEERSDQVKPEEIAALQQNELRAHNPSLVEAIEKDARTTLETKVSEMETEAESHKPVLDLLPQLRGILGLKDDTDEITVVQTAISKIKSEAKSLRESILDKVLEKRFKDADKADVTLLRRVLVGEMQDVELVGDEKADEKVISEMVDSVIDGDDDLKKTVSEMEEAPAAPPTTGTERNGEWKPGMSTSNVRVKARV